ncbi:MAG: hypothetical protein H0U82_09225 [Actinobacteria bacterium]|nr:hypothetical protein [Actinomycetota bacterium]
MKAIASISAAVALAAVAAACGDGGASAGTTAVALPTEQYSLAATSRCLRTKDATIGPLRPRDARLRAMRDLAQRTSREVRLQGDIVGIAFQRDEAAASLLIELLRIPSDPYRLVQAGNVVVMSRRADRAAHSVVVNCLRP